MNFGYDLGSKISLHGAGLTHYGFGVQDYRMQIFSDQLYSDITFGYGSSTAFTETFRIKGTGTVGIGTSTPNNSALVDMASTTKGFLPPRMNTTQMYQLGTTAPEGMTVYNTTTKCLCVYNGWKWICNNDGESCGDVLYYGQTYNTVVIGNQCWFKQNLNRGDKIDGATSQTNNGIIEKYCYNNNETNCGIYGGLYQWNEMMNYAASSNANPSGVQGICPTGWHIPSDEEFCKAWYRLDPTVGSCSNTGPIGTDIGSKLKEAGTTHWMGPNTNTNTSGFSALGAGMSAPGGYFYNSLHNTYYWTSREYESNTNQAWGRSLSYNQSDGNRADDAKYYGKSVRCVKD